MSGENAWLRPKYMPPGFKLFAEAKGIGAGEFGEVQGFYAGGFHGSGSEEQVAIHYRRRASEWGSDIVVSWARDQHQTLVGTSNHAGVPANVSGMQATYHDGTWAPGPGTDQLDVRSHGMAVRAHWDRDSEHSLTMRTDRGIIGLRCPRTAVTHPAELIKIMASIDVS